MLMVRSGWWMALAASALVGACSNDTGGTGAGAGDAQADGGTIVDQDGADGDAALDDTGLSDTVPSDTVPNDTVPSDTVPSDTVPSDSVPSDTGLNDTVPSDGGNPDGGGIPAAWQACKANADCLPVELGCCDHCNGGKLAGFHKDHIAEAKAALAEKPCDMVACTEKACGMAVAWCEAGSCKAGPDPAFGGGCKTLDEAKCGQSPSCQPLAAFAPKDVCDNGPEPKLVYQGCGDAGLGGGAALTCARKEADGSLWVFPSTMLAAGFSAQPYETCCKPGGGGACDAGNPATLAKFCLQPASGVGGLKEGEAFNIVIWPQGCMSSSCTKVHSATCNAAIDASGTLVVEGAICLENTGGGGPCTADCGGGGFATCAAPKLEKGSYKATLGGLSLSFQVPSPAEANLCAGAQW